MIIIPPDQPDPLFEEYDFEIPLGEAVFRVVQRFFQRQESWYLSLFDAANEPLIVRKRMSIETPILHRYEIPGLPPGELALLDQSGERAECGFADLGHRCILVYFDPEDFQDLVIPDVVITDPP